MTTDYLERAAAPKNRIAKYFSPNPKPHYDPIDGDQVIAEYDSSDTLLRKFIYGPGIDEPILMDDGMEQYYYHFDGLGSVTELTDSTATVVEKYTYDVYGKTTIKNAGDTILSQSAIGNPYGFTGRRLDSETGLYYYRRRYYSPALGRFLQTDPIGYLGGINLYTYVSNNPINWIDPWGLEKEKRNLWGDWYDYVITTTDTGINLWEGHKQWHRDLRKRFSQTGSIGLENAAAFMVGLGASGIGSGFVGAGGAIIAEGSGALAMGFGIVFIVAGVEILWITIDIFGGLADNTRSSE